jgi:hypothetical protein
MYLEMIDQVLPSLGRVFVIDGGQSGPLPLLNLTPESGCDRDERSSMMQNVAASVVIAVVLAAVVLGFSALTAWTRPSRW